MMRGKSIWKTGTALLFAGIAAGFSFYTPFQPGAVHTSVPASAGFVYHADSANEFLLSPVGLQFSKTFGDETSLQALLYDHEETREWVQRLSPSELVVASFPAPDGTARKIWTSSSWVGWRSPWLRWRIDSSANRRTFDLVGKYSVWPVWQVQTDFLPPGMALTCALTDNLFIACMSENPNDIRFILDTYDKRTESVATGRENRS